MADPRDPYNPLPEQRDRMYEDAGARGGAPWMWIAGGVAVVLLIMVFAFSSGTNGDRTAQNTPPASSSQGTAPPSTSRAPENTGAAPTSKPAPAPRNVTPPAPGSNPPQ